MINAKRIEEMKRLSAEATPGPWEWRTDFLDCEELYSWNDDEVITASCGQNVGFVKVSEENAQFIAESRQFVPDIIAAYEAQVEEIAVLRKALEFYADDMTHTYNSVLHEIDGGHYAKEALAWRNTTRK